MQTFISSILLKLSDIKKNFNLGNANADADEQVELKNEKKTKQKKTPSAHLSI